MTGLKLQGIRRSFSDPAPKLVLSGIDLAIETGEFVALVGPSGRGKTTLLRIIAGLDEAYEGTVTWAGGRRPRLAAVFQEPRLVPWLSVLGNLRLVSDRDRDAEARALLTEAGLAGTETAFPGQLSGGMQRRVALVRALLVDPEFLVLDEPILSLDPDLAQRMREWIGAYWRLRRPTVLLVTHDLREAAFLATRILVLGAGEGTIVVDLPVDLSHPRRQDDPRIEAIIEGLAHRDPMLLADGHDDGRDGRAGRPQPLE